MSPMCELNYMLLFTFQLKKSFIKVDRQTEGGRTQEDIVIVCEMLWKWYTHVLYNKKMANLV